MIRILLHSEGAAICITSLYILFAHLHLSWWFIPIILIGPDISMAGYLHSPKTGAILYNTFHTLMVSILLILIGWATDNQTIIITGLILTGHIGMDRAFGFGLKYASGFKDTHFTHI